MTKRHTIVAFMVSAWMACEYQPHAALERTEMALKTVIFELEKSSITHHCLVPGEYGVSEYLALMDPAYPVARARQHRDAWGHEIRLIVRYGPPGLHVDLIAPGHDGEPFTPDDIAKVAHVDVPACE